jgi:hypothetical protein
MTAVWLRAMVRWCVHALVLLLVVGAVRLAFVAWERRPPTVVHTPVSAGDSEASIQGPGMPAGFEALRSRLVPAFPSALLAAEPLSNAGCTSSAAGCTSRPKASRVYLIVAVRPDRSEVLVNGVAYGRTPYVGEVSCPSGGKLSVTILPPKGAPRTFERACDRREIRIDD